MEIKLVEVSGRKLLNHFIRFPRKLYRGDPNFVFEPESLQREFFSKKNPFFGHSSARFFLAMSEDQVVGRIAIITNSIHNDTFHETAGFFGFFESIENYEVAKLLLDKAVEVHRQQGFDKIMGPTNFTTNDSCGFLVSGFDKSPVVLMPYNKGYYADFLEKYGFEKEIDLSSYGFGEDVIRKPYFGMPGIYKEKRLAAAGIRIRNISFKHLEEDIIQLRHVYNESNRNNWGFIPLNEVEFKNMAFQFRSFVPEKMVLIAEKDQRQIAFLVALPDLNQVFRKIRSGKLLPFGFISYLWYKQKIDHARILILGILDEYRNIGLDLLLYERLRQNMSQMGFKAGEACYVLENNRVMNSILHKLGFIEVNGYRIFKIEI